MANVTDSQAGAAFAAQEFGQPAPYPGDVQHLGGQPAANAVVINDAAGSGLTRDVTNAYKAAGQFGVHLAVSPPAGQTVNVDLTVFDPATGITVSPTSLAFTSGNFSADQLVTLSATSRGQARVNAHVRGGGGVDSDIWVVA